MKTQMIERNLNTALMMAQVLDENGIEAIQYLNDAREAQDKLKQNKESTLTEFLRPMSLREVA